MSGSGTLGNHEARGRCETFPIRRCVNIHLRGHVLCRLDLRGIQCRSPSRSTGVSIRPWLGKGVVGEPPPDDPISDTSSHVPQHLQTRLKGSQDLGSIVVGEEPAVVHGPCDVPVGKLRQVTCIVG